MAGIEAQQSPDRQGFDSLSLRQLMERLDVPGLSVAVIDDFEIQWATGDGAADAETGRPVDAGTLFQAASISKPVTALALVRPAQECRLRWTTTSTGCCGRGACLGTTRRPRSRSRSAPS